VFVSQAANSNGNYYKLILVMYNIT